MAATAKVAKEKRAEETALDMTKTQGERRFTYYQPGLIERAHEEKRQLRVVQHRKLVLIPPPNRKVHREDLLGSFCISHKNRGEGKYIHKDALGGNGKQTTVTGAQNVNPYLASDGSYHTIIETFHHLAKGQIEDLVAKISRNTEFGQHLEWIAPKKQDDAIALTPWQTKDQLWELACSLHPDIKAKLKKTQSNAKGVIHHAGSREKFFHNIDVLRRARKIFVVGTGEFDVGGGETPYSMPLEQCGFAIDFAFLTTGIDENKNEIGGYYYRMAYGRSAPWVLYRRHWLGMSLNNKFAYLNEDIRQQIIDAMK